MGFHTVRGGTDPGNLRVVIPRVLELYVDVYERVSDPRMGPYLEQVQWNPDKTRTANQRPAIGDGGSAQGGAWYRSERSHFLSPVCRCYGLMECHISLGGGGYSPWTALTQQPISIDTKGRHLSTIHQRSRVWHTVRTGVDP